MFSISLSFSNRSLDSETTQKREGKLYTRGYIYIYKAACMMMGIGSVESTRWQSDGTYNSLFGSSLQFKRAFVSGRRSQFILYLLYFLCCVTNRWFFFFFQITMKFLSWPREIWNENKNEKKKSWQSDIIYEYSTGL